MGLMCVTVCETVCWGLAVWGCGYVSGYLCGRVSVGSWLYVIDHVRRRTLKAAHRAVIKCSVRRGVRVCVRVILQMAVSYIWQKGTHTCVSRCACRVRGWPWLCRRD